MKVIFLDVDGVLNHADTKDRSPFGFLGIDRENVKLLQEIVQQSGAEIVLVSTWKEEYYTDREITDADVEYLVNTLAEFDLKILDRTYDAMYNRGHGIRAYLDAHPEVESWVVLDDETFGDYSECGIIPHHVKTYFGFGGLRKAHVKMALSILRRSDLK